MCVYIVFVRCGKDSPLGFDFSDGPDVVLGGKHELVVKHPLRLVIKGGGWMELHCLVILHQQVVACAFQVGNLIEC